MEVDGEGTSNLYLQSQALSRVEISHAKFWSSLGVSGRKLTKKSASYYIQQARLKYPTISDNYLYSLFNSLRKFLPPNEKILPRDVKLKSTRKKTKEESVVVLGKLNLLRYFTSYIKRFDAQLVNLLLEFRLARNVNTSFSLPDGLTTKYDIDTGIAVVSMLCLNLSPSELQSKLKYKHLFSKQTQPSLQVNEPFFRKYATHLAFAVEARYVLFEENLQLIESYAQQRDEMRLSEQPLIACTLDTIYKAIRNKYVYINKLDTTQSLGLRAFRKMCPETLNEFLN